MYGERTARHTVLKKGIVGFVPVKNDPADILFQAAVLQYKL